MDDLDAALCRRREVDRRVPHSYRSDQATPWQIGASASYDAIG
jgi:hypothetical protein